MNTRILPIFLAGLLLPGFAPAQGGRAAAGDIPEAIVRKVDPSVVAIQHENAGGSGFVVSPDGYILTNGHVVQGRDEEDPTQPAKSITVILNDERKFPARVIGFSLNPDVALIKIDAPEALQPVEYADSRDVQIGQRCFAVGMPNGLKRTFTRGILSNIDRTDLGTETKVFQTDAAINPGNSGGPLFDIEGRVLGLNTYASRGNNLGFTIPIHVALVLKEHYLEYGRFTRSDLPTYSTSALYSELAQALGVEKGVLVSAVLPGSKAYAAGLREGDIIVELDGKPVSARTQAELLDFDWEVSTRKPGSGITYSVQRGAIGARQTLKITAQLEPMERIPKFGLHAGEIPEHRYDELGLGVREIVTLSRILNRLPGVKGVLVSTARQSDPAGKAGLREGDIITRVAGQPVSDLAAFQQALEAKLAEKPKAITLTYARGKATIETALLPYYQMRGESVLLIAPEKDAEFVDLMRRELIASGAAVTVSTPKAGLKGGEHDVVLFAGGPGSRSFKADPEALRIVKEADAAEKVIAAVGSSVAVVVHGVSGIKDKKLTIAKEDSAEVTAAGAEYTGKAVENDGRLVTSTGFDRAAVREFLKVLYRIAREND
jgi:serine protease Do